MPTGEARAFVSNYSVGSVDSCKRVFDALRKETSWKQIQSPAKNCETLREIADVFMGALEVAGETESRYTSANKMPESANGETRYSIREGMSEDDRYRELKHTQIAPVFFSANENAITEDEIERMAAATRKDAKKYVRQLYDKFNLHSPLTNEHIEIDFGFSRRNLRESLSKQDKRRGSFVDYGKMLACFRESLKSNPYRDPQGQVSRDSTRESRSYQDICAFVCLCRGRWHCPGAVGDQGAPRDSQYIVCGSNNEKKPGSSNRPTLLQISSVFPILFPASRLV